MAARRRARRSLNHRFDALSLAVVFLLAGGAVWLRFASTLPGQDVTVPAYVTRDYLTVNPWSRPGTELKKINGVVIHYVGNPGTTASGNRNYFESLSTGTDGVYASAHFVVGLDGEVIQCIPLREISYASNTRNDDTGPSRSATRTRRAVSARPMTGRWPLTSCFAARSIWMWRRTSSAITIDGQGLPQD